MAVYVGTLYAIQWADEEEPTPVVRKALGVCEERGIVTARTRRELREGKYDKVPARGGRRVKTLWYQRKRRQYPGGSRWYHDLDKCFGFPHAKYGESVIDVTLRGQDVHECPSLPANFLCG